MPLFLAGLMTGALGTLIGAGGGFILVPLLMFLYPEETPEVITAISLAVVFFNALSGTVAYARLGRIDYRSAIPFILVSMPGSFLGVELARHISRKTFDPAFGICLLILSLYLLTRQSKSELSRPAGEPNTMRTLKLPSGENLTYSYDMRLGVAISSVTGFISSLLGIGGGIIHVPAMVHILGFPVHVATATSHLTLMVMALVATIQHHFSGALQSGLDRIWLLAPGVVLGAQIGAYFSLKMQGTWILRLLAIALLAVALRLIIIH